MEGSVAMATRIRMSPTSLLNFMLLKTDTFLQLLYLKELTMQKERANISTRMISLKGSGLISNLEKSRTTETFIAAAAGMGRPSKSMLEEELVLNLASLNAPHMANKNAADQPGLPADSSTHKNISSAGASPKVIRSANESYSTPNLLVVLVALAILPSKKSNTPPINMAIAASTNLD